MAEQKKKKELPLERQKRHIKEDLLAHGELSLGKLMGRYNRAKGKLVQDALDALVKSGEMPHGKEHLLKIEKLEKAPGVPVRYRAVLKLKPKPKAA